MISKGVTVLANGAVLRLILDRGWYFTLIFGFNVMKIEAVGMPPSEIGLVLYEITNFCRSFPPSVSRS